MALFTIEHSKAAYGVDFAVYGAAVAGLAVALVVALPRGQWLEIAALVATGLAAWTAIEYAIHRFVLHGMQPFRRWHTEHHERPTALICAPTIVSALLIATLVFLPAWISAGIWRASALTLGVLIGYLAYAITHHATHHWPIAPGDWLYPALVRHLGHHYHDDLHFGIVTGLWDRIFGTAGRRRNRLAGV